MQYVLTMYIAMNMLRWFRPVFLKLFHLADYQAMHLFFVDHQIL